VCEYNYEGGTAEGTVGPPQDPGAAGYCMSVRRESLDATLQAGAIRCGVLMQERSPAATVILDQDRAVGVELADGSRVSAGLVVGADGRRSMVARAVRAADVERHAGVRALYYRYVEGMAGPAGQPPDGAEFSRIGDELAYVFPSDAGLTCVAISVNLDEYARVRRNAGPAFDHLLRRHLGLWPRYAASTRSGRLLGSSPQDDYVREAAGPGWALVGDAGVHQDPWSGAGMDCAAISAQLLVESYAAADRSDDWISTYRSRRDDVVVPWFHETVSGAADLAAAFD
jgi:flavin-dependent dehydrogenase